MKLITTSFIDNQSKTTVDRILPKDKINGWQCANLFPEVTYQSILGFGGAITEAAGYAYAKLSEKNQRKVIDLIYGPEGNRYNMVRSHMDSCDFSLGEYTAMDNPEDLTLKSFSLTRDEQYLLPLLRDAQNTRGETFDLMLSPWSPPAFMKTNGDRKHGGKLKPEYRELWADYLCRYSKEYELKGFPVSRLTIQNEPEAVQTWDSCNYTPEEAKEFIRDYMYPALLKHNLSHIKIAIWDHNKERMYQWAKTIIDQETDKMIDGIAFHWYSGDHFEALKITEDAFPKKQLIFTEGCVEYSRFNKDQLHNAQMYGHDMIGNLNHGMTGFIDWNILLDEKGGPNYVGNYCDAPIMVDTQNGSFEVKLSFDYIGHFSKYIDKGAKRIALCKYTDQLEMTAFLNPNDSVVAILLNRTDRDIAININLYDRSYPVTIAKHTIATAVWEKETI